MPKKKNIPTMKDVAREAGVALGTVSKVVNGIPVGKEYRVRVEKAIKKLDYHINSYAKGLKSGKTMVVAVMIPNLVSPYFSLLVNSISRALIAKKYRMVLFSTDYDPEQEEEYFRLAEQQKVDGIICLTYNPNLVLPDDIPLISIDRYFSPNIPCVTSDNYGGGWLAAEKLKENGCKRVAILRIGSKLHNEPSKRRDGFAAACQMNGLECTQKILNDGEPFQFFADFLSEHFHNGKLDFDGLFCATDSLAHQIIVTLRNMGLSIPEDVQVIGFDGCRYFGDLELTCSTIIQPVSAIAETCVSLLLNANGAQLPSIISLPVTYGFGGTTFR